MYDKITTYEEAVELVKKLGFMPLSKNPFGFVSLGDVTLSQNWHTNEETDPWLWKDRIAARVQEIVPSITDKDIWRFLGVKE